GGAQGRRGEDARGAPSGRAARRSSYGPSYGHGGLLGRDGRCPKGTGARDGRRPSTRRARRKPACGASGRRGTRSGRGAIRHRWGRVPGMFAHSTLNQNWWWTASPAAR
ncbi:trp operon leader peptide, partial [Streptomyces sp. SID8499]|nr:trp operon leader peptide [Streptomyces sp. SID8499]